MLVGLGLLAAAGVVHHHRAAFLERAVRAEGHVVGLVPRRGSKGGRLWAPRVEFRDGRGAIVSFVESVASNPPSFHEGEVVKVAYEPGDEQGASIDSFSSNWLAVVILTPLGTVFTGLGFLLFRSGRRR